MPSNLPHRGAGKSGRHHGSRIFTLCIWRQRAEIENEFMQSRGNFVNRINQVVCDYSPSSACTTTAGVDKADFGSRLRVPWLRLAPAVRVGGGEGGDTVVNGHAVQRALGQRLLDQPGVKAGVHLVEEEERLPARAHRARLRSPEGRNDVGLGRAAVDVERLEIDVEPSAEVRQKSGFATLIHTVVAKCNRLKALINTDLLMIII